MLRLPDISQVMEHTVYWTGGMVLLMWMNLRDALRECELAWAIDHYMCWYGPEYWCRWHRWRLAKAYFSQPREGE